MMTITIFLSLAAVAFAAQQAPLHTHAPWSSKTGLMRKEVPQFKVDHSESTDVAIDLQGGMEEKPAQRVTEAAVLTEQTAQTEQKVALEAGLVAPPSKDVPRAEYEKSLHAKRLADADEALYHRLFPEDRDAERKSAIKEAQSVLQTSGEKAFRIKVPVAGGKKLCLTEGNHGYTVRAEPCRRGSSRQKWYWAGRKMKNLFSSSRCLGLTKHKHHIKHQSESMVEIQQARTKAGEEDEAHGLHLSMDFHCADNHKSLTWAVDDKGRLKNTMNSQCMAASEEQNFDALVLPCDEPFWTMKHDDKPFWTGRQEK